MALDSEAAAEAIEPSDTPPTERRAPDRSAGVIAHNVRRLMAQQGMSYDDVVGATGLDSRTIRGLVRGDKTPRAKTLHQLAEGLGVSTDDLFLPPVGLTAEAFDAATNPVVDRVQAAQPELFEGWTADDFAELASRFGVGGGLTEAGAIDQAQRMNENREVLQQARVVLETPHGKLLSELVNVLYRQVRVVE